MKVTADLSDCKIELGKKGIVLTVTGYKGQAGHLYISQETVEWRRGKIKKKIVLSRLLELLEAQS